MKKVTILIVVMLMVLSMIGCAADQVVPAAAPAPAAPAPAAEPAPAPAAPAPAAEPAATPAQVAATAEPATEAPAADARVIRMGCTSPEESNFGQGMRMFERLFEEYTNGAFDVQPFPNAQLGNERDLVEGVGMGTIEMCVTSTGPIVNFSKDMMLLDLPYVILDTPEGLAKAYEFMDGPIGAKMLASLEASNIKGLGFWENGFRNILNSKREVKTVEDLKGLKIRTMENEIHMAIYNENGASGIPMAHTEAFTALQQGVIDGMDNILGGFWLQGSYEVARYLTMSKHFYSPAVCQMNLDLYNSLSPEHQDALKRAILETSKWEREFTAQVDAEYKQNMIDAGLTVTEVDFEEWKKAAQPLYDKYLPSIPAEYVEGLMG